MKSDLHCHSIYSDGSCNVKEIADTAKRIGLDCIALTDHDCALGVGELTEYGASIGLKIVPGIELSATSVTSVHVLGYNIDYCSPSLLELTRELLLKRHDRKDEIINRLHNLGVNIDNTNLIMDNVGRFHIAREMQAQGLVNCTAEAFEKYIGEGKPAYVPSNRMTPLGAVEIIAALGGYPVIAHPMTLYNMDKLVPLIEGLIPYGLAGLEVYYPSHTSEEVYKLSVLARRYGMIMTGGSDYHGLYKSYHNQLGASVCELPKELY